ncbi:MAG: cytochrome c biogenesis protein CcsA [Puniceicoccales bacterium]|jgi:ABC-type uncharacterized transport system permease subunit|nr:cytochrome c biogenesis protein CcsA [Puniceicoccales bacterium]
MELSSWHLFFCGTLLYAVSLSLALGVLDRWERRGWGWAPVVFLALGFLAQLCGFCWRGAQGRMFPLGNAFELSQGLAWGVVALTGVLRAVVSLRLPVALTAGLAVALGGAGFANPEWDRPASAHFLGSPFVALHVGLVVLGYCLLAAQALIALVFLLQNHSLERRRFSGIFRFLPPLRQVDGAGALLMGAGFAVLSLGMFAGLLTVVVVAPSAVAVFKFVCATGVWAGYGAALFLRRRRLLPGVRFAWVSLGLFGVALLVLWPANAVRGAAPGGAAVALDSKS